ncbi:MAG: leucyl/phenylalanyl-tRNA--protein transferase [Muribaculaceae bacterium]|nr:leucyl/phenylalanyl-tRNA--protein transferase [Muribaculaceae bacterium]
MYDVKLTYAFTLEQPEKKFVICDMENGTDFIDPLILFNLPNYDIHNINSQGLYAIGGQPETNKLIKSYKWGIFPWFPYKDVGDAYWYCPRNRFVIFPEKIHVSHSLKSLLNKNKYFITINKAFRDVIHNCRMINGRDNDDNAWLGETIEKIFIELNNLGLAKSIEVWEGDKLVGGFYGFWHKGVFQGESMFSLHSSASQIGLILLCKERNIEGKSIKLIDTQFETPTFKKLGGEYISYNKYREIMNSVY